MGIDASFLRGFDLFRSYPEEELERLAGLLHPRLVDSGQILCRQGEAGTRCFLLVGGTVSVYRELPDGSRVFLAPLLPGALFGQVAVFDGLPRTATCEAQGSVRVLEIDGPVFLQAIQGQTRLAVLLQRELSRSLVRQLRMTNQRLSELEDAPEEILTTGLTALLSGMDGT